MHLAKCSTCVCAKFLYVYIDMKVDFFSLQYFPKSFIAPTFSLHKRSNPLFSSLPLRKKKTLRT